MVPHTIIPHWGSKCRAEATAGNKLNQSEKVGKHIQGPFHLVEHEEEVSQDQSIYWKIKTSSMGGGSEGQRPI